MMKSRSTVLYLGNDLSEHSNYHSAYQTLKLALKKEDFVVYTASSKKNQWLRLIDMLWSIIKQYKKVDYVLIDTFSTKAFYFAYLSAYLCDIIKLKYIPILHGGNLPNRLKQSPKLAKFLFSNSYKNVAPSTYLKAAFEKEGFESILIPNPVAIESMPFLSRKECQPKLLYVRAFADIYNPTMAIKVLLQLKKTYPMAILCMVGPDRDGSLAAVKTLIQSLELEDNVRITGVLPQEEWHKLSTDYDIFINTTNVDNTPLSLIETMALGLPIVSTNVGGIPNLVVDKKEALLCDANNIDQMTNHIIDLIEEPALAEKLSLNGRKKAEQFDWEVVKHQWFQILK